MNFDAGLFFILLGTAFILFFIKTPYREAFITISCAIFLVLGTALFSDIDVSYISYTSVNDGITTINGNSTFYIIGDATDTYNETSKFLAFFFLILGIVTGLISVVMFIKTDST